MILKQPQPDGVGGCCKVYNIPKAIFYLLKGDYKPSSFAGIASKSSECAMPSSWLTIALMALAIPLS